jgi:hypothetical protein
MAAVERRVTFGGERTTRGGVRTSSSLFGFGVPLRASQAVRREIRDVIEVDGDIDHSLLGFPIVVHRLRKVARFLCA